MERSVSGKLKAGAKTGYAAASIGDSASFTIVTTYLIFFLTTVARIDAVVAGSIAAVGAILDATWGPIVGYLSDGSRAPAGRRRPFIFRAAFPLAITSMLLFMKVGDGTGMSILYYTALTIGFWISFGTFFVPYAALGAEITDDYDDRSSIRSFAYIGNQAGMFFGMVAPPFIVSVVADLGHGIDKGWTAAGAAVGITVLLSLLFTVWATRGYERYTPRGVAGNKDIGAKRGLRHMVKSYREILGLKPMLILLLAAMLSLVAFTVGSSAFIYFLTFNLGLSESNISAVMLVKLGSGIALAPVVLYLAKRTDRRITLIICCAFTTVFILVQYSVGIISIVGACVMAIAFDVFGTAYWQLVPAIIYDICELDEFENGTRREGSVVSTLSFAESLSSAISLQMLGIILKISGFDGGALTQSESSLDAIAICTMVLPAVLMAVVVVVMCMYPISKGEFARIKGEVERRRRG